MDKASWRRRAERELGRPIELLDYTPVPDVRLPALLTEAPPSSRGSGTHTGWAIAATYAGAPEAMAEAIEADVEGGVEVVRIDPRAFRGARDLASALRAARIDRTAVALHRATIGDAALLVGVLQGLRRDLAATRVDFGLDPIGTLAASGTSRGPVEQHLRAGADLARWSAEAMPSARAFLADATVYHDQGADEAWSIALAVATGLTYLRAMESEGMPLERAFGAIELRQAIPGRFFLGIAKLRATRRVVARLAELCQVSGSWRQTAVPARREHCSRDLPVNILRNTGACFAAVVGGAHRIELPPHRPGAEGRRLARNTQLVLREEARLAAVADPAGGSYALETLTERLALRAWALLQQIERQGGLLAALQSGFIQDTIRASATRLDLEVRTRRHPLLGVSRYPDLDEPPPPPAEDEELPTAVPGDLPPCSRFEELLPHALKAQRSELTHARVGPGFARIPALPPCSLESPFVSMRQRADRDPRSVFLATLGPLREHSARTAFGRELLAAGGLRALENESAVTVEAILESWRSSGTRAVLLSAADTRLPSEGAELVEALHREGAAVWCLGRPLPELEAAGARGFFAAGGDAVSFLLQLWEHA